MSARTFDKLTALDNMCVRVVDGNVEAEGLKQDVLIAHQLLGLQRARMKERIKLWLDPFDMSNFGFCMISVSPLSGTVQIWNPAGGYLCAGRYMTPATANIKIEQTDYIDSLTTHIDLYYNGQQGKGWRQDVFAEYLKDKP